MNEMERLVAFLKIQYHNLTTLHRHLTNDPAWFEDHWNIEGNYKIAHMLGGRPGRRPPVEDDDDD